MRYVFLAARIVLAGIFLYAGIIKASASAHFAVTLMPFTILPQDWIGLIAFVLPLVEILAAILLLIPRTSHYGAALVLLLSVAFISLLGWALHNEIIVACGCFGQDETPSAEKMQLAMGRDVLIALVALAIFIESLFRRGRRNYFKSSSADTPNSAPIP
ncbi:hypothetical protein BH09VER1_BH09VER1_14620 [soil metagenome]